MNYIRVKGLVRPNAKRQYLEKTEQTTNMCSDTAVTVVKYTDHNDVTNCGVDYHGETITTEKNNVYVPMTSATCEVESSHVT